MVEYFRIKKDKIEYKGERYFKLCHNSNLVVQVCITPGPEDRRGKNAMFGVYTIQKLTFFANYLAIGYAEKTTKRQFESKFNKICTFLK